MSRNFIVVLTLIVAGMVGLFAINGSSDDDSGSGSTIENAREVQSDDRVKGAENPKVTLIEYADFGCPGCAAIHPLLQQLEVDFADDLQIVFRDFPLISLHPNTMSAHRAALAAGKQDKFWEMHDILFERQDEWSARSATQQQAIAIIESYANELALNVDQFNEDIASTETFNTIDRNQKSGSSLGLTGTPSLLLNGEDLASPRSYDELQAAVQAAIDGGAEPTSESDVDAKPEDQEADDTAPVDESVTE